MIQPTCLSIALTNKCPLQCKHCGPSSGPDQDGHLGQDLINRLLREASKINIPLVNFSGGEPFVYRKLLAESIQTASSLKIRSRVTTGGYWATSLKASLLSLEPLKHSGLSELFISVSDAHLEFHNMNNVLNAVRAAREFGVDPYLVLAHSSNAKISVDSIIEQFEGFKIPVPQIQYTPIIPFGRAKENYYDAIKLHDNDGTHNGICHSIMRHPTIYPNGQVAACGVIFGSTNKVLQFGNIIDETLSTILERMNYSPFANYISHFGLNKLIEQLPEENKIEIGSCHENICHLCGDILHNEDAVKYLKEIDYLPNVD